MDRYSPSSMFDYRYGYILATKLTMVLAVLLLTAVHTVLVGPRLLDLQEAESETTEAATANDARTGTLRRRSIMLSVLTLLLSLAILFLAALLQISYAFGRV